MSGLKRGFRALSDLHEGDRSLTTGADATAAAADAEAGKGTSRTSCRMRAKVPAGSCFALGPRTRDTSSTLSTKEIQFGLSISRRETGASFCGYRGVYLLRTN